MDQMNKLIVYLMAICGCCKNLHYNIPDYGIHLFADRVQDGLDEFIDEIKENCILAVGDEVLNSSEYFVMAAKTTPDVVSLNSLKDLLVETLQQLELQSEKLSLGSGDLLGRIGNHLQNSLGVLNILEK